MTPFEPQPARSELPVRFENPFRPGPPAPLVRRAAETLQERLRQGAVPVDLGELQKPGGGKMFGVLVVATPDGQVGSLSAFSGMLAGRWQVEGFVPPVFEGAARDAFWPAAEAELDALGERHAVLSRDATAMRERLEALTRAQKAEARALRDGHVEARRHLRGPEARTARAYEAEEGARLEVAHAAQRAPVEAPLQALDAERRALEHLRAERSRTLWRQLADTYLLSNARSETRRLGSLFAPEPPPGGAGDCAAPKLLAFAYRHGLRPLGLAEFWWGADAAGAERRQGDYSPACEAKCGRVLPFMLEGLHVTPGPAARERPPEQLAVLYEDAALLVLDKPRGLASEPPRHAPTRDSVLVRLRKDRSPGDALQVVQAMDAESSGLLLVAKDEAAHLALRRQLARREAQLQWEAWLEGTLEGDSGTVALPLGAAPKAKGRPALTEWHVAERTDGRTRVLFTARSTHPHQLRVHAAQGLGAPVVGDRLYGRGGERLLLHARMLHCVHPHTGEPLRFECPPPF
ncbi:RluA family pseudouridine synthase [Aggregicoccus sp. 17bor-14]|nr:MULTISPECIES: RluA family pseudouridine synthase [Myxococcaceae]MBF5045614.1 RluA family pseudouridine synthase [Simulacricoccus sp. 17bor-14]MRI91351.1 RluA family pseudouridine synthase [Aggregicoccus sp. 17bor-14]